MVSFWPWRGDDSSPASFEKALSALSTRIIKTNTKLDTLRQSSRRYSALWTLYTSFAYLLCAAILILVVGWREWGVAEYVGLAAGPVLIYIVRTAITTAYGFRISKYQAQSNDLQKQREATIEKLKNATKYNTTQQLLEKYGGTPPSKQKASNGNADMNGRKEKDSPASGQKRTTFIPPPTANIPGRNMPSSLPGTPQRTTLRSQDRQAQNGPFSAAAVVAPWVSSSARLEPSADFAPNAFSTAPQYARPGTSPRWYDRLMDVLLGEDETLPKNRLALICYQCRLVNGQAPPGVQRLEEVGKWRCSGCGFLNGEENEETKLLKKINQQTQPGQHSAPSTEEVAVDNESPSNENGDNNSGDENEHELSDNDESLGSEETQDHKFGKSSGAQKETASVRRRSSRVKRKAKE
ncbi:MAG: hypothetical protein L6R37_004608 [Teloschistes peruensis]|nr:MAG: hypothetical protein L6R37_004608 [Teloschistes peruensis]